MKHPPPAKIPKFERQLQRRAAAEEVCRAIEVAFAEVTLGSGVGLKEGQAIDDYADDATRAAFRATDEKDDWRRITAAALNRCSSSLSFFDAAGMRFHLPAFLIAHLHGEFHFGIPSGLIYLGEYAVDMFALLSAKQRAAVRNYLLHLVDDPNFSFERPHIIRALTEYWFDAPSF